MRAPTVAPAGKYGEWQPRHRPEVDGAASSGALSWCFSTGAVEASAVPCGSWQLEQVSRSYGLRYLSDLRKSLACWWCLMECVPSPSGTTVPPAFAFVPVQSPSSILDT